MARWLRRVLLAVAAALFVFGVSFSASRIADGSPFYDGATFWCAFGGAALMVFAALKLSPRRQFLVVFLLANALLLELLLQATAWLGWLPGITAKDRCAYGRVYWTSEGRGNSIRNRQGWYAPAFNLNAPRRIAVIGDSLVEAVEVHRTKNLAVQLRTLLPGDSVIGLGCHGTAPAHYLEILAYAERHFHPTEAVLVLSTGSDVSESAPELGGLSPEGYITYDLDEAGRAVLRPASVNARARFSRSLEAPHASLFSQAPLILRTHCMALQVFNSLRGAASMRQRLTARTGDASHAIGEEEKQDFLRTGFDFTPFAMEPVPEAIRARDVMLAELRLAKEFCAAHGITLRLVASPCFPAIFYRHQRGPEWTRKIGAYDYAAAEHAIAAFAKSENIPCLALSDAMSAERLDVEKIRSFFFVDGTGHFTERGHAYAAAQIQRAFFSAP